jgi:DNA polymerase-3 subunit delta'
MSVTSSEVLLPWQGESWRQLQQLRERLPHALLFYGAAGTGKTQFVEAFAKSLLCESPTPGPCLRRVRVLHLVLAIQSS